MNYKSFLIALFFLSAISGSVKVRSDSDEYDSSNELIFHAIQSETLRKIMDRINQSHYENELNEFQQKEIRQQNTQLLFVNVNELLIAADLLTQSLSGFDLSEDEKNIFQAMAKQLQEEAYNIRRADALNDIENMNIAYQRLTDTCTACHELFRF